MVKRILEIGFIVASQSTRYWIEPCTSKLNSVNTSVYAYDPERPQKQIRTMDKTMFHTVYRLSGKPRYGITNTATPRFEVIFLLN